MNDWAIETTGLTKCFGDLKAVDDLNLKVPKGSIFGFLGPNGAGKTTTIKMLLGSLGPTAGGGRILGFDIKTENIEIRRRTGYISETQAMYNYMSVREIVGFCKELYPTWDDEVVARYIDSFELPVKRPIRGFSKGMKSQLALILALGPSPELLILDEPTSGLDPLKRHEFLTTILKEISTMGKTIFFSSHVLSEVERVADHIGIIHRGKLLISRPIDEMKLTEKKIRAVFQKEPPEGFLDIPCVTRVEREGKGYLITVSGDVDLVLSRLESFPYSVLETVDLNLEDIFMEYVGRDRDGERTACADEKRAQRG